MKVLVIGLGNPLLGDDGVGWRVAEAVQRALESQAARRPGQAPGERPEIEVDYHAGGGLSLMERLVGYDQAVIVDAITTGRHPTGHVECGPLEALPSVWAGHLSSAHETDLPTALSVGRSLGASLPGQIDVVTIEAQHVYDFSETLTLAVAAAVPEASRRVLTLLEVLP